MPDDTPERVGYRREHEPPFDDSEPCIFCPMEVRGMHATAHNAVGAFDAWRSGNGSLERFIRKMWDLKQSVQHNQPRIDAHFADQAHSHGRTTKENQ